MKCLFCDAKALFKCSCDQPYFCDVHLGQHLAYYGSHCSEIIEFVMAAVMAAENQKNIKSRILKRLEKIEQAKS